MRKIKDYKLWKLLELQEVQVVGKSTVCKKIKNILKAEIIDADDIARKLTSKNSEYLEEIVKVFGNNILNESGVLNRQALANIIYNNIKAKETLDKLTFKYVCKKIEDKIESLKENSSVEYVLIDAPLLLEAGVNNTCDFVIAVIADIELKLARICLRDGISVEIAKKRLAIQQNDNYYIANSDVFIENNNDNNLEVKIQEVCNIITNI